MHFDSIRLCRTGFVAIAAVMISVGPAISEKVGVTAAVNPTVTGQPPGQTVRQLKIGSDVIHNERIRSTSEGSMQLILVDRTTLTISPNSDITINDFVFDRSANSGKLAVTIGKGLMRYVGGQVSHSGEARITTPSASLGIRGGMALINSGNGKTTVVHLYGVVKVTTGSNSKTIIQPGYYVETSGGQISVPGPAPASLIASYNAQLQSKSGQTAGAKRGHVTADKLNNMTNGKNADGSPSERPYQSSVSTQPSPTGLTASSGGNSPGGGVGGGGGGIGGASGPAWGLLTAPGQGNFPAGPPGQVLKGIKGGGKP
jgi:hypothetical protein